MSSQAQISDVLERNLRALVDRDRALVQRLLFSAESSHLQIGADGRALYCHHRVFVPLEVLGIEVPAAKKVLWCGLGVGDGMVQALRSRGDLYIVGWERDPFMLRTMLSRHDLAREISNGRLQLKLGVDVLELAGTNLPVVDHPVLKAIYGLERHLLEHGASGPRVTLSLGKLFVDDLALALRKQGYVVVPVDDKRWSAEELTFATKIAAPAFSARINYTGGLAEFAEANGVPLVVWEIDPATDCVLPPNAPTSKMHIFTYREKNVDMYRRANFDNVEHLPLAAPIDRRRPLELDPAQEARYASPVTFIGASLVDTADRLEQRLHDRFVSVVGGRGLEEFKVGCREVLDLQARSDSWILPELFEERFGSFLAAARADAATEEPLALLAERAASERRLAAVTSLAAAGIQVWGDKGFEGLPRVNYRGSAGHGEELTLIYNAAEINVDVGRLYQNDIVTMRVFDVLACGGFLLTQYNDALAECFEIDKEVAVYRTLDELPARVKYYQEHPDEARAIAAAGHKAVVERHAMDSRVQQMLSRVFPSRRAAQQAVPAA